MIGRRGVRHESRDRKKIAMFVMPPPERVQENPTIARLFLVASGSALMALNWTNGTGRSGTTRYAPRSSSVKRILFRRSGTRNMFRSGRACAGAS